MFSIWNGLLRVLLSYPFPRTLLWGSQGTLVLSSLVFRHQGVCAWRPLLSVLVPRPSLQVSVLLGFRYFVFFNFLLAKVSFGQFVGSLFGRVAYVCLELVVKVLV